MGTKRNYPAVDQWGRKRTPYAVICSDLWPSMRHGLVYLTEEEYDRQMDAPSKTWRCPICRHEADWDDDNFEQAMAPPRRR